MTVETQTQRPKSALGLRIWRVSKCYRLPSKFWQGQRELLAADKASFEIDPGKTLALVGSSGSGKSTLARCVTRLERPDDGEIWLGETNIAHLGSRELRPIRSRIQMIFQDPIMSMNPRMSALQVIEEPLLIKGDATRAERRMRAAEIMSEVRLSADWLNRRITEFSGGQRQRIAIARALTLDSKCLVLDEALSGLDLKTQWQLAELLLDLQAAHSLTYLLISHDLTLVERLADAIAVMAAGRIVEQGPSCQILSDPEHPETRTLVFNAKRLQAALSLARGTSA